MGAAVRPYHRWSVSTQLLSAASQQHIHQPERRELSRQRRQIARLRHRQTLDQILGSLGRMAGVVG